MAIGQGHAIGQGSKSLRKARYRKSRARWRSQFNGHQQFFLLLICVALFLSFVPSDARGPLDRQRTMGGVRLYYAPEHNLADIDKALIAGAKERLDMAAYVLTDRSVMEALIAAANRGVRIRLYLDPDQPAARNANPSSLFANLLSTKGIEARVKTDGRDLMHLKSYHVDGRILRTGAANFSYSGMRRQDNDLLVIESATLASEFIARFNVLWDRPGSQPMKLDGR